MEYREAVNFVEPLNAWVSAASTYRSGRHPSGESATYGLLKSSASLHPCQSMFVNRTSVPLRVLWLDFEGKRCLGCSVYFSSRFIPRGTLNSAETLLSTIICIVGVVSGIVCVGVQLYHARWSL
jgi:hypothetical protein